jgi:hypothetical protein
MLHFSSYSTRMVNTRRGVMECLESALGDDPTSADLLIWHASLGHDFQDLVDASRELAPQARVVAASCCGVVGREGVSESMKDIALMAVQGKEFAISHCNDFFGRNAYEKSLELAQSLKDQDPNINMVYFLGSGIDTANDQCIRAFEEVLGKEVTLFGATSSDNMKGLVNYQAVDGEVMEHGAYAVGFSDPTLRVETQATHGFVAVGEPLLVTKAQGHIIQELNGKPAWEEFTNRLGLDASATPGDTIPIGALAERLSPELAKEYGNNHILRVVTTRDGNDMHYATEIAEGTELWLTTRDEPLIFSEMDRIVGELIERIGNREPVAVFHADCLARGRFLFNRIIKEELVGKMQFPFFKNGECPPWLGMYGFGEFARLGGENEYHNYTTALYVITR